MRVNDGDTKGLFLIIHSKVSNKRPSVHYGHLWLILVRHDRSGGYLGYITGSAIILGQIFKPGSFCYCRKSSGKIMVIVSVEPYVMYLSIHIHISMRKVSAPYYSMQMKYRQNVELVCILDICDSPLYKLT